MAGFVSGTVRDAVTSTLLPGVNIYIFDTSTDAQITDSSGVYTSSALPMGSYNIVAYASGYQTSPCLRVNVMDRATTTFNLRLVPMTFSGSSNFYAQKTDGTWEPVSTNNSKTLVTSAQVDKAVRTGCGYTVSTGGISVAAFGFIGVQLSNPVGSGKTAYIWRILGGSTTNTLVDFFRNGSLNVPGTSINPYNSYFGYPDASVLTARYASGIEDPTSGGDLFQTFVQIGGAIALPLDGSLAVTPGTSLTVRLTNSVNQPNLLAISITYWEEPE